MLLVYLVVLHLIADFFLQSREMGQKKSSEPKWLAKHLGITFGVFLIALLPFFGVNALAFASLNMFIHGVIDATLWNIYKWYVGRQLLAQAKIEQVEEGWTDETRDRMISARAKMYRYWEDSKFFDTIGIDQSLHIITLIIIAGLFLK